LKKYFEKINFKKFWDEGEYSLKEYTGEPLSEADVKRAEKELGYKLPSSYIELLRNKNGGIVKNDSFKVKRGSYIEITGIFGINDRRHSLFGDFGSRFMIEEWGYPDIGIVICDTPSAGHDLVMLDYRKCGKDGEPQVVHIDQEADYEITFLAENFEAFILGLKNREAYQKRQFAKEAKVDLERVKNGSFSPILLRSFDIVKDFLPDADVKLRRLAVKIVEEKGHFSLHADELSTLMYDYLFWLFTRHTTPKSFESYLENPIETSYKFPSYELMIAFDIYDEQPYDFNTKGYASGFLEDWWKNRVESKELIETNEGFTFSEDAVKRVLSEVLKQTET
jgi:hypothetical protein